jgi:hypothetical protein
LGRALASALRILEERVALARGLERQAIHNGHRLLAETWAEKAQGHERELGVIHRSIRRLNRFGGNSDEPETADSDLKSKEITVATCLADTSGARRFHRGDAQFVSAGTTRRWPPIGQAKGALVGFHGVNETTKMRLLA